MFRWQAPAPRAVVDRTRAPDPIKALVWGRVKSRSLFCAAGTVTRKIRSYGVATFYGDGRRSKVRRKEKMKRRSKQRRPCPPSRSWVPPSSEARIPSRPSVLGNLMLPTSAHLWRRTVPLRSHTCNVKVFVRVPQPASHPAVSLDTPAFVPRGCHRKAHKRGGFKQQSCVLSRSWRAVPSEDPEAESFLVSPAPAGCEWSLACGRPAP